VARDFGAWKNPSIQSIRIRKSAVKIAVDASPVIQKNFIRLNDIDASLQRSFDFLRKARMGLTAAKILARFRKKTNMAGDMLRIGTPCFSGTTYGAHPNRPIFR
jgi:hypothetical protein